MELNQVMAVLRPGENVSPDLSTYQTMVATWRGSGIPPTEQEVNDKWIEIDAANFENKREAEYLKQGITDKEKLDALWEAFVNAKSDQVNILNDKIIAIDAAIPEPI